MWKALSPSYAAPSGYPEIGSGGRISHHAERISSFRPETVVVAMPPMASRGFGFISQRPVGRKDGSSYSRLVSGTLRFQTSRAAGAIHGPILGPASRPTP